jgi:dipeptidyl-peptidase-4
MIGNPPDSLAWSPDGKHLTYLDGGQLVDLDPANGQSHILVSREKMASLVESGGSEQDRDRRERYHMSSYFWSPDSAHLLFDSNGRLWYYDLKNGTGVQVANSGAASGDDPKFSPDGKSVSFLHDHGIRVVRIGEPGGLPYNAATAPGTSSGQLILDGAVDWVYEEELDTRSNYFWSPDSRSIAYLQMNETSVPTYPIADWIPTHATVDLQRYPQPGDANPDVHLAVVPARGGKPFWVRVPFHPGDDYIPRFGWVDSHIIWEETVTRDHQHRFVYFADFVTGQWRQMVDISDDKFVDGNYDVIVQDGKIVLTNWSSGHNHLYLYSYDTAHPLAASAKLEKQLTNGSFEVGDVYRVDVKNKLIDYASNEGNPLELQLWQAGFDGSRKQLTTGPGFHQGNFAPVGGAFSDEHSTRMTPPTLQICAAPGKCSVFWQTHAVDAYALRPPEQLEVKAHDGTTLYATLLLPEGKTNPATVPMIVNPYGGPGTQTVANQWKDALLFDELLAQNGFAVLHADNRGMSGRGRAFAQFAYRNFGPVQLEDQLTVIDSALARYPQLDAKRMGWWGWSWGGTFTLWAMTHSDRFPAGVAVAPVTNWRNYDSVYTERYMGSPVQQPDAYRDDSVINSAAQLKGHLLLVHGTGDDNVHLENTVQFVQQLIEAQIPYDLQLYPRKTHSITGADVRTHLYNRILSHFERYLAEQR